MNEIPRRDNPDVICRKSYQLFARECRRQGLSKSKIERSLHELTHQAGAIREVKDIAYKPTGIALGRPLPDNLVTRRLWRLSRLVEKQLSTLCSSAKSVFAFVPNDWYHVTIVNVGYYTGIESGGMAADFHQLSEEERQLAQDVITDTGPIVLHLNGLVLTRAGGLIIPGFPTDNRLYELRRRITEALPQTRGYVPMTAHIKLGHVLVQPNEGQLKTFLNWLALCGEHVSAHLTFHDAYTPAGRITL